MKKPAALSTLGAVLLASGLIFTGPIFAQANPSDSSTTTNVDAVAAPLPAATIGNLYFLDCDAPVSGIGSMANPWNSLTTVNETKFGAGDQILLKRGSSCEGTLRPLGSGEPGSPIIIDAYGTEEAKPLINGAGIDATVQLSNQQYWEIRNLEITNIDADTNSHYKNERRGLVVKVQDIGQANHYRIENLNIHDVYGEGKKDLKGSGGIQFEVYASDNNSERVPTWFNDVVIANNTVENVNRSGINMSTRWKCRAEVGWANCNAEERINLPWTPSTGLVIRGNTVKNIGGDGIVVQMNKNALVEYNTVSDTANMPNGSNAGVWSWNADGTTFQYNEVFGTKKLPGNNDGNAFDVDYGTNDTLFQYNYSHDNEGGMMLFCGCGGLSTQATFRYNVSENDKERTNFVAGGTQNEYYNNTIILPNTPGIILNNTQGTAMSMLMANNLIVASDAVTDQSTASPNAINIKWRNNAFSGPGGSWPADPTAVTIADKLALAAGTGLERFKIQDSRIAAKGLPIAPAGTMDFFGNPVPSSCAPDIGAFQFSAVDDSSCEVTGQMITAGTSIDQKPVRTNTTYKVSGTLAAGSQLSVTNPQGFKTPAGTNGEVVFATAMDATTVNISCEGPGNCSEVNMVEIDDRIVDGSFDALSNTPWTAWNTSRDSSKAVSGSYAMRITGAGATEQFPVVLQPNTDYLFSGWASSSDGTPVRIGLKNFTGNQDPNNPDQFQKFEAVSTPTMKYTTIAFNSGNTKAVTVYCYKPGGAGNGFCDDITMTTALQAPTPSLNPSDTTVTEGHDAYFFSSFVGAPRTSVLWQSNVNGIWTDIASTRGTALTLPAVTADMNGMQYRALIYGPTGPIASEPATLTVAAPLSAPLITNQPKNSSVNSGESTVFTATATANPSATVQWESSINGSSWTAIDGATESTLSLPDPTTEQNGLKVRAIFTNALGAAESESATLAVAPIATQPPTTSPTATSTATATPTASISTTASEAPPTPPADVDNTSAATVGVSPTAADPGTSISDKNSSKEFLAHTGANSLSLVGISGGLLTLVGLILFLKIRRQNRH